MKNLPPEFIIDPNKKDAETKINLPQGFVTMIDQLKKDAVPDPEINGPSIGLINEKNKKEDENIWAMLNDLVTSDPKAYENFVKDQIRRGKSHAEDKRAANCTPEAGFVVGTFFNSAGTRNRLFINICQYTCLQKPKKESGELEVPLILSNFRVMENTTENFCIDVVVHPWCIGESKSIAGKRLSSNKGVSTVSTDELDTLIFIFNTYYNFSL